MNTIEYAIQDVEYAFTQLEFAIRLMCYCELDHLDREKFDNDITIRLKKENAGFLGGNFVNLESTVTASQMLVGTSFGVSAIVLDAAYEAADIKRDLKFRTQESDLRLLVYMVRCAFAHNMAAPKWDARGPDFMREFNLPIDGSLIIDLTSVNEVSFEYEHIGGFTNWYKIKSAVVRAVRGT